MGKIIDISHHQGDINWAVASKDMDYVVIRTSYSTTTVDRKLKEYVAGAKKYKVPFGHYHYAMFKTQAQALAEAKKFVSLVDSEATFLFLDLEDKAQVNKNLVAQAQVFIDYVKKATGKPVGLYTGNSYYHENKLAGIKHDCLWIARYSSMTKYGKGQEPSVQGWDIWQYSSLYKFDGIPANTVDINVLSEGYSLAKLINKKTSTPTKKPSQKPSQPSKAPSKVNDSDTYTVKAGDTLSGIAGKFNTTTNALQQLNNIKNINKIYEGQVLKVVSSKYYTKVEKVEIIKPAYLYTSKEYKERDKSHSTKVGEIYTIVSVTRTSNGTPRLKTKSGYYLTANKAYVKKLK